MDAFIGTILPVAFDYAPAGWHLCDGSVLQINSNQALYSIIGTAYGGNGVSTFALPDLRGRVPVGFNTAAQPLTINRGQAVGAATASATVSGTLTAANLPAHTHDVTIAGNQFKATSTLNVTATAGGITPAAGNALGAGGTGGNAASIYVPGVTPNIGLNASSVTTTLDTVTVTSGSAGSPTPAPLSMAATVGTVQPSLGINFIICLQGLFPSRP